MLTDVHCACISDTLAAIHRQNILHIANCIQTFNERFAAHYSKSGRWLGLMRMSSHIPGTDLTALSHFGVVPGSLCLSKILRATRSLISLSTDLIEEDELRRRALKYLA